MSDLVEYLGRHPYLISEDASDPNEIDPDDWFIRFGKGGFDSDGMPCVPDDRHPCGHTQVRAGCGGCDPGAVEFVLDNGATAWRKTTSADFTGNLT